MTPQFGRKREPPLGRHARAIVGDEPGNVVHGEEAGVKQEEITCQVGAHNLTEPDELHFSCVESDAVCSFSP